MPERRRSLLAESIAQFAEGYRGQQEIAQDLQTLILKKQIENIISPPKWQPTTKEEALEFEKTKSLLKRKEEKTPSWGQEQKVAAMRSGLKRGRAVIGKEWGEPEIFPIKTEADALKAIEMSKLDPSIFQEELKLYEWVSMLNPKGEQQEIPRRYFRQALREGWKKLK